MHLFVGVPFDELIDFHPATTDTDD
jgi:hypothetical protein